MFERVASLADIEDGGALSVAGDPPLVLFRIGGEVLATQQFCTHEDAPLVDGWINEDCTIECPWHGARFDLRTGGVLSPPATKPLRAYAVRIDQNEIFVNRAQAGGHSKGASE